MLTTTGGEKRGRFYSSKQRVLSHVSVFFSSYYLMSGVSMLLVAVVFDRFLYTQYFSILTPWMHCPPILAKPRPKDASLKLFFVSFVSSIAFEKL